MPTKALGMETVRNIVMMLPHVKESSLHGAPSWKVHGKLLACEAIHRSTGPDTLMVRVGLAERTQRLAADPGAYYLTEHYANYPAVLVRLAKVSRKSLETLLRSAWTEASAKAKK